MSYEFTNFIVKVVLEVTPLFWGANFFVCVLGCFFGASFKSKLGYG
jgi:hypothetical protein